MNILRPTWRVQIMKTSVEVMWKWPSSSENGQTFREALAWCTVTCILALLDRIPCMKQCSPPSSLTSSICSVFGQHLFQFMHPQQCYFLMTFRKSVFGQCVWVHLAKIIFNQTSAYSMLKTYMQPSSSMACATALSWYFHVPVSWINQWWLYKPGPSGPRHLAFSAAEEHHQNLWR